MIFHGEFTERPIEVFRYELALHDIESLTVNFDGPFEHIFMILRDPGDTIRAILTFKSRIKSYHLGTTLGSSMTGTLPADFIDGVWKLNIVKTYAKSGKFMIEIKENIKYNEGENSYFSILDQDFTTLHNQSEKWYKGELHTHSYYTDGRVNYEEIKASQKEKVLDFMSLTEHSFITTKFLKTDALLVPGVEITCDNDCHYNIFGVNKMIPYDQFFAESKQKDQSMQELFSYLFKQNYLLSINHPFAPGITLNHQFDIRMFSTIEVINAPHVTHEYIDNNKAIRLFDFLWQHGYYLFGIGGSDAHTKNYHGTYPLAIPENHIYMKGLSINNLLDAVKKGQVMVFVKQDISVKLTQGGKQILPGSEVSGVILFEATTDRILEWNLIENGCCIYTEATNEFSYKKVINENTYIRLEARLDGEPVCFVNPVYNQLKNKEILGTQARDVFEKFKKEEGK